jgi:LuxR family maltose regulon positive regulatory protein
MTREAETRSGPAPALSAKLAAPLSTGREIERAVLTERVLAATSARLALLRAPAGFGKTTLMLEIRRRLARAGVPTAWLTLDPGDDDVGRFLSALEAALAPLALGLAATSQAEWGPHERALALMDAVATHNDPFALFLDDFESVQGGAVLGLVRELIDHLPSGARVVIGSRGAPELGLGRMRASGHLVEVEPTHLRFTLEEAGAYLRDKRGLSLSSEDVSRLHRRTEGWAAALWIASVSLESRENPGGFIAGFTGSNAAIVDYLLEDVLSRQNERTRRFMLRTSVVADLTPALCDRLCECSDSLEMLHRLERDHLFLVPIEGEGPSWRYHSMFRGFLRSQLHRQSPAEIPKLHGAAARWYLEQDRPVPAIDHLLAAGETDPALRLLSQHAEQLLQHGRLRLLARWLDPLQARGRLDDQPGLQLVHAWATLLGRGPRAAEPLLTRLEAHANGDSKLDAHRKAMRLLFLVLLDRTEDALDAATALVRELPGQETFLRGFVEVVLANLSMIGGRYQEALRLADAARSRGAHVAGGFMAALSQAAEAAVDLTQGRLRKAIAHLRLAVRTGADNASGATNGNAMAGVLLAEALYEADETDQAERLLTVYIPLIRAVGIPDQLIIAHRIMARIALRRGDADRAQQLLAELEMAGHRDGLVRVVASARLERARMMTVQGRLDEARAEIDRCEDRKFWDRIQRLSLRANDVETWEIALARWNAAGAQPKTMAERLRVEIDISEQAQRTRRALTQRLVLAQSLHRGGQGNKAMRLLARTVRFAASEGYVAALRDEGPHMLAMLRELRCAPHLLGEEATPPAAIADFIGRVIGDAASASAGHAGTAAIAAPASGQEVLTRKERRILALTAHGFSNNELAKQLFVAETTVRTHLRNINAKLGARNRLEAIAIARKSGWIA